MSESQKQQDKKIGKSPDEEEDLDSILDECTG